MGRGSLPLSKNPTLALSPVPPILKADRRHRCLWSDFRTVWSLLLLTYLLTYLQWGNIFRSISSVACIVKSYNTIALFRTTIHVYTRTWGDNDAICLWQLWSPSCRTGAFYSRRLWHCKLSLHVSGPTIYCVWNCQSTYAVYAQYFGIKTNRTILHVFPHTRC